MPQETFTPALAYPWLTGLYDRAIAMLTREKTWRARIMDALAPRDGETIVDLGAGTGSLAMLIKAGAPGARVVAVDPDPAVRAIGEGKARAAGTDIVFVTAMGNLDIETVPPGSANAVTCSLVLHQCPMDMKRDIVANAARLLRPGGRLVIADYGAQPDVLMRAGFLIVQCLDGFGATEANRLGAIPRLVAEAGFDLSTDVAQVRTPTGAISVWRAQTR
ncbi:MAG TPA: class I SAM-dependent methyltransferase [Micropepsaceae bacterium]|nr:class I SAM-dependent methyltransferase [Micropepsaceae bacterium]